MHIKIVAYVFQIPRIKHPHSLPKGQSVCFEDRKPTNQGQCSRASPGLGLHKHGSGGIPTDQGIDCLSDFGSNPVIETKREAESENLAK